MLDTHFYSPTMGTGIYTADLMNYTSNVPKLKKYFTRCKGPSGGICWMPFLKNASLGQVQGDLL